MTEDDPFEQHFKDDDEIQKLNSSRKDDMDRAAAAARKQINIDNGRPIVELSSWRLASSGEKPLNTTFDSYQHNLDERKRRFMERFGGTPLLIGRLALIGAVATVGVVGANMMFRSINGNQDPNNLLGEPVPEVSSITTDDVAHIRFDPYVSDGDYNNSALLLDKSITIDVNDDARKRYEGKNGYWYGVPIEEARAALMGQSLPDDPDGMVWINEHVVNVQEDETVETK